MKTIFIFFLFYGHVKAQMCECVSVCLWRGGEICVCVIFMCIYIWIILSDDTYISRECCKEATCLLPATQNQKSSEKLY